MGLGRRYPIPHQLILAPSSEGLRTLGKRYLFICKGLDGYFLLQACTVLLYVGVLHQPTSGVGELVFV